MGAGCPKRWETQRELQNNNNKKMRQSRDGRGGERETEREARPEGRGEGPSPPAGTPGANRPPWTLERRGGGPGPGSPEEGALFEGTPFLGRLPSFLEFRSRFKKKFYVTRESLHFCGIQIFLN